MFTGSLSPVGVHTPPEDPNTWRTMRTDIPAIMGVFPPNVLPEEIESDGKDRIRALIVAGANPLRSYADTLAYERTYIWIGRLDPEKNLEFVATRIWSGLRRENPLGRM